MLTRVALFVGCVFLVSADAVADEPLFGRAPLGGVLRPANAPPCVSSALLARLRSQTNRPGGVLAVSAAAPLLPIQPLGANLYEDVLPGIFVDVDPASGTFGDFACRDFTYDGHQGHDIGLRSFGEQVIGVPVFAVRDGVVLYAQDGFEDMNLAPSGDDGNYLAIDHGGGLVTWYFHLRKNSVAFAVGQSVTEGQQIGLVGSSGYSFGPHLHFGVDQNGVAIEPMAGACGRIQSLFAHQPPLRLDTVVQDFGVTTQDLFMTPGHPLVLPTEAQIPLSAGFTYFWMRVTNIPPASTWRVRFVRPDGSVALDSQTQPWGNSEHIRFWPGFFYWWVPDLHTIPGTWRYQFDFNGETEIDAPFEAVVTVNPSFNRPPSPITLAFDPPAPTPAEVLFCRVGGSLITDDLDWDIVRYRYVWQVNGVTVRDVVSAGRADALPRGAAPEGALVKCTVTPGDGKVDGPAATISATSIRAGFTVVGGGKYGHAGVPYLAGSGALTAGSAGSVTLTQARQNDTALLFVGTGVASVPLLGGTLVPSPIVLSIALPTGPGGGFSIPFIWPAGVPSGTTLAMQVWLADGDAWLGAAAANGLVGITP